MIEAFTSVIHPERWRETGSAALGYLGRFEDRPGAHWTAWADAEGAWLGVTMPGKRFNDWPVATFILREISDPRLPSVLARLPQDTQVDMAWWRTVWQGRGRLPRHLDQNLTGDQTSPWVPAGSFDSYQYSLLLKQARECLDATRGYRGRGSGTIRLLSGEPKPITRGLTPEFQFRTPARISTADGGITTAALIHAREVLQPLYTFIIERSMA